VSDPGGFGGESREATALIRLGEIGRERDEALAQMCQAIGRLSTIAEDCEAWLNNQCDETACEFIKAMRDYARKAVQE
jgi:hypothetical protein